MVRHRTSLEGTMTKLIAPLAFGILLQTAAPVFAAQATIFTFDRANPSCQSWTDTCRTCARGNSGAICSNVGIACQPKQVACTQRDEAPKKAE
jgi:hypothetical protein